MTGKDAGNDAMNAAIRRAAFRDSIVRMPEPDDPDDAAADGKDAGDGEATPGAAGNGHDAAGRRA